MNAILKRMGDDGQWEYRCAPCVDSVTFDTMADGTDYDCSYCGRDHEDGLDSTQRWMLRANLWHCDYCLAFAPKGEGCEGCNGTEDVPGTACAHPDGSVSEGTCLQCWAVLPTVMVSDVIEPVSLVKPFPKGARVIIASEGQRHEWVVIGREAKGGKHTGWVRVEYQGWLSAFTREADVETEPDVPICRAALPTVSLVKAVLPDYVTVYAQGMTADVVVGGVVIMSLPPRIWIKERPRAVVMILERLAECGVTP